MLRLHPSTEMYYISVCMCIPVHVCTCLRRVNMHPIYRILLLLVVTDLGESLQNFLLPSNCNSYHGLIFPSLSLSMVYSSSFLKGYHSICHFHIWFLFLININLLIKNINYACMYYTCMCSPQMAFYIFLL